MISHVKSLCSRWKPSELSQTYQKEVAFLVAIGLSIFYLTAITTFNPNDPSFFSKSFPPSPITNLAGSLGAFIASLSFYSMGAISYLLPFPFLYMFVLALLNKENPFAKSRLWGLAFFFLSVLNLVAATLPSIKVGGYPVPSAGALGGNSSQFLLHYLGGLGFYVLVLTTFVSSLLLLTHLSILRPLRLVPGYLLVKVWLPFLEKIAQLFTREKAAPEDTTSSSPSVAAQPVIPIVQECPVATPSPVIEEAPRQPELSLKEKLQQLRQKKEAELFKAKKEEPTPEPQEGQYAPPPVSIFKISEHHSKIDASMMAEFEQTAEQLVKAFSDFAIKGEVVGIQPGPVVTVFEFEAAAGTKLAKMLGLIDDIALALRVDSIFIHPVSGKRAVGIQVPNKKRETVFLGDVISSPAFRDINSPLAFAMGKSLKGEPVCGDITAMPHLLMAGQTGAGKSVAINSLLCSVIMKASPDEVRMILVDPKILELKMYEGIPHLLMPVITEPSRASQALKWATVEMDRRYRLMECARVRHISGFNTFWEKASDEERKAIQIDLDDDNIKKLPYILIVIDELADLMLTAPKEVESYIQRLAQKARACGIHLVLATQRPSVDVITGVIKANLPCRIAFKVFSRGDSRTILDAMGADKLLGKGDMLYLKPGTSKLERIQGAFLADEEVNNLVEALRKTFKVNYDDTAISWIEQEMERQVGAEKGFDLGDGFDEDPKWDEAIGIGQKHGIISASFLQRHLKIGYNRAARIVEAMEAQGLVEHASGSKPRKWLGSSGAEL